MEYQKIKNLLEYTTNQRSKFRTRNWNEVNDDSRMTIVALNLKLQW